MSLSNNYPTIAPSLSLDFANTGKLDPRITFSRASTATYYDGVTTAKAEENLFLQSQTLTSVSWGPLFATIAADTTTAPDGTTTADTITATASTGIHRITQSGGVLGTTRTLSVFAKASTHNFIQLYFGSDGNAYANFNITTGAGAVGTVGSAASASIVDFGNGWYRCVMTTSSATADTGANFTLIDSATSARAQSWTTVGTEAVFLWGAQLEQRSSVTSYTATITSPITNYIPVLMTAASNVARFDHTPTTGAALGLLIEESRTNLLTYSSDFSNAAWTKTDIAVTANINVAPNGSLTASKIVASSGLSGSISQTQVVSSGAAYSSTVYAKAGELSWLRFQINWITGTRVAWFNLSTGAVGTVQSGLTASIASVGNGWYRCTVVGTSDNTTGRPVFTGANADNSVFTGNGYSGIYIWGAQLEAGAFPTSYIPTVASTVTRQADVASMTGTNFSSWYNNAEGTILITNNYNGGSDANPSSRVSLQIDDGGLNNRIFLYNSGGTVNAVQSLTNVAVQFNVLGPSATSAFVNTVFTYKTNDAAAVYAGGSATTDTTYTPQPAQTALRIGAINSSTSQLNGTIKSIAYYPARLTNAQLQAITS